MSQDFDFVDAPEHQGPPVPPPPPPSVPPPPPRRPAPVPSAVDPLYRSPLSVGAGLLIVLALTGGLGYLGYDSYKNPPPESKPADTPGTAPAPTSPSEAKPAEVAPTPAPVAELSSQVDQLKTGLKATADKVDELAARPVADTKPIEAKVAALDGMFGPMSGKLQGIDEKLTTVMNRTEPADGGRIEAVEKKLGEVSGELNALKASMAAMSSKPAAPAPEPPKPTEDVNKADDAMSEAVDLYGQKKYAESLERFTKLQADHPDDARVWYFSALANGFATKNFRGETERLVNLGVEKEKAGSPEKSKIDAIFASLTAANGKDWLAAYRARAASR